MHARRLAAARLNDPEVVKKLFDEIAPRYAERARAATPASSSSGRATGDAAEMVHPGAGRGIAAARRAPARRPAWRRMPTPMATYQSIIAYDGTDFAGFQRLAPGGAPCRASWSRRCAARMDRAASLLAAGRTDTGVHARGQVVAYRPGLARTPAETLTAAPQRPPAGRRRRARARELAPDGFHPRFSARRRTLRLLACLVDAWPGPAGGTVRLAAVAGPGRRSA